MNVIVTLNPGIGAGLGPDFLITCDVIGWSDMATDTELYFGVEITIPDEATTIFIQSLGLCFNILSIPIEPLPDCDLEGEAIEITTTTTTSTSTSTTTTTTTTVFPCNTNYSIDNFLIS